MHREAHTDVTNPLDPVLPPGTPSWITVDLAIEMLVNVGRLADLLYETRPRQRATSASPRASSGSPSGSPEGERAP